MEQASIVGLIKTLQIHAMALTSTVEQQLVTLNAQLTKKQSFEVAVGRLSQLVLQEAAALTSCLDLLYTVLARCHRFKGSA